MNSTILRNENLDKIDQFLVRYNLPKYTLREIVNLNMLITIKEIESITFNPPIQTESVPDRINGEFYKLLGRNYTNSLQSLLEGTVRRSTL